MAEGRYRDMPDRSFEKLWEPGSVLELGTAFGLALEAGQPGAAPGAVHLQESGQTDCIQRSPRVQQ